MTRLAEALALTQRGFWVFPLVPNSKLPAIEDWPNKATRDPATVESWWRGTDNNIGIATSKFSDHQALVVVDVDTKKGKNGHGQLVSLELQGFELPPTLEQSTPSGGKHLIYAVERPLKQGVDVLGPGLDIRSRGGFIVGPGSEIDGKRYAQINGHGTMVGAPDWLVSRLGAAVEYAAVDRVALPGIDLDRAADRAVAYLKTAPVAVEGEGGDTTTYKVAAALKDLGCDRTQANMLMREHWNERCDPPWDWEELDAKISHAYRYGREPQGSSAPEAIFDAVEVVVVEEGEDPGPLVKVNREYAFVRRGAFVLQETTDADGQPTNEHLNMAEFHGWFANKTMCVGKKTQPLSQWWLEWEGRREYESVVFEPQRDVGKRWYNLWRGFSVEPKAGPHPALDAFLEHALMNVCNGDKPLCNWLLGYFAHLVQRPWEKPLVTLVFKGKKGTGKNALIERVGFLLGAHFMVADDDRYLLGNFNKHLESCLLFALDEAAWAGDKKAEGRLKGLTTGKHHNIERKGQEVYKVKNLTRVAVIGNEQWLVPASDDERRYGVFNVGEGRMQDRVFFKNMRVGMEQGGYGHLLHYLMTYPLDGIDVDWAPNTQGLIDQKHASLDLVEQWWFDCLMSNAIAGGDWGGQWPDVMPTNRFREAFGRWARIRNIRSRLPEEIGFGRTLKKIAPSFVKKKTRPDDAADSSYSFFSPGIAALRLDWERYIGGRVEWTE